MIKEIPKIRCNINTMFQKVNQDRFEKCKNVLK